MSSIAIDQPNPALGDIVTFTAGTDKTQWPWIEVVCVKDDDGEVGYAQTLGAFLAAPGNGEFQLGPTQLWAEGGAHGTATLFSSSGKKRRDLASCEFTVTG